ncbi:transposase [Tardibacter chloracetimidivorans]|uniref:Transposase n=1 Tax=Tardibacter chloracetimidivorans TaxID=1921510 RepID=A0A1L3ZVM9_9SPHN|nr:transposase [Tardibacter chloracetimidivorans]
MISFPSGARIWLALGVTDMRFGMPGLMRLVQHGLGHEVMAGDMFVFRGRQGSLCKILWTDALGVNLYAKRLEEGHFVWPSAKEGVISISASALACLLDGIEWRKPQARWRPTAVG